MKTDNHRRSNRLGRALRPRLLSTLAALAILGAAYGANPQAAQGGEATFPATGTESPATGAWDILDPSGASIANSAAPAGWTVSLSGTDFTVGSPASAPIGANYRVRFASGTKSATFDIVAISITGAEVLRPAWAEKNIPFDRVTTGGRGPSSADAIDAASGVMRHSPPADIVASNPVGPDASYRRTYRTSRAKAGAASAGLSAGWYDNYDYAMQAADSADWTALTLTHPDGATEVYTPVTSNGTPTGAFSHPNGVPYVVQGVASATKGAWTSLSVRYKDLTTWTFLPTGNPGQYRLAKIANVAGSATTINRDATGKLASVTNDAGAALLSFTYSGSVLATITDIFSRKVAYGFSTQAGTNVLTTVSQVVDAGTAAPPAAWQYGYAAVLGAPFLNSVGAPDASAPGTIVSHPIVYNAANGRAESLTDADGNVHQLTYNGTDTDVVLKNADGTTALARKQRLAGSFNGGSREATGDASSVSYFDPNDPAQPSSVTNENGQSAQATWDRFGNPLTQTDRRGIVTTYAYDYTNAAAPFGLLTSVQTGSRIPTSFTYYPNGRLYQVLSPVPGKRGAVDGVQQIVSDEYAYTAAGNVATHKVINSTGGMSTYTYNYTSDADGNFTAPEALGQPLTVTDPLGAVTHFRYYQNGQMWQVKDAAAASGVYTTYTYTKSGQVASIVYPKVNTASPYNAVTTFTYAKEGGDLLKTQYYDEGNYLVRTVNAPRSKESALRGASGGAIAAAIAQDALGRPASRTDGNNNTTTALYDLNGNLKKLQYQLGDSQVFTYDPAGNVVQRITGQLQTVNYTLAPDDSRVTAVRYPNYPSMDVTYVHDDYSRITTMTDGTGATDYAYDDLDNVLSVTYRYTGLPSLTIAYTYNSDGSRKTMTTPSGTFAYGYDSAGQFTQVNPPWASSTVNYLYKANGLLRRQTDNRTTTNLSYDVRGALSLLSNLAYVGTNGSVVSSYSALKRDGLGNLISYTSSVGRIGSVADTSSKVDLTYDGFQKVSGEKRTFTANSQNPGYQFGWVRDAAGNIVQGRGQLFPVDKDNRTNASGYAYNNDGAATSIPGGSFQYDVEHRPTAIVGVLANSWRGDGLRGAKDDLKGKVVRYLYDLDGLPVAEVLPSGVVYAAYLRGPNGLVQRWQKDDNEATSLTWDPVGNLVMRHKHTSAQYADTVSVFDALGQMYSDLNTSNGGAHGPIDPIGPFAQAGLYTDEQTRGSATGLGMARTKYYDPFSSRFLSREDRFGNSYVEGDDGSAWLAFFNAASFVPIAGAPFAIAMGAYDVSEGNYLMGGLAIAGAVFPLAEDAVAIGRSLRLADEAAEGLSAASKASRFAQEGRGLSRPDVPFEYGFLSGSEAITTTSGRIVVSHAITDEAKLTTLLRHEYVHWRVGRAIGGKLAQAIYDTSGWARYLEEATAEGYAQGSLRAGLRYPFEALPPYVTPGRLVGEAAGVGAVGGAAYWYTHRR